ncbi:MAG: aminoglycoside phosphotransferase family protein [Roseiflexaceae bacterium]|nr:aminoglycoside phosphotransferase family protein [Roseiflexaceae bacterium]
MLAPVEGEGGDQPRRRVLGQLGEYVAMIVRPLNLRPRSATLLSEDATRVEVRVSTDTTHIVVALSPENDMAAELYLLRVLSGRHLPIPRLIAADLSCALLPFPYIIHGHVAGSPLSTIEDTALVRVAARQIGRAMRHAHQVNAPGFGRPTPAGRWTTRAWNGVLSDWLGRRGVRSQAGEVLGEALASAFWAATVEHAALECAEPCVIHGAIAPAHALVTVSSAAHVEALIRPGEIVGGDPLFDLALATLPRYPAAFQQGIYEGYSAAGPLGKHQHVSLQRMRLLLHAADTLSNGDAIALARLPEIVIDALGQL